MLTIFLTGRECPFTCVFCDLWRFTIDEPTPVGAIPAQIAEATARGAAELAADAQVKLYNASNFFEAGAVPPEDDREILLRVERFARVIVECHPRLVRNRRCRDFAAGLDGRLQVAMGLETVHPEALPRLNKQATLDDVCAAAEWLDARGVGWRAFVLLGAPFVPRQETVRWAELSARFAFDHGAAHVALIPVRGGNGEMDRLRRAGLFTPPTLRQAEQALEGCLALDRGVVTVDTWDLDRHVDCPACGGERIARLERINLSGEIEPRHPCATCGTPAAGG